MGKVMNYDDARVILFEVADVLDAGGASFFLQCGTALGAYHSGDFIKGDMDIDLGMLIEDFQGEIVDAFLMRGFKVQEISKPWNFCRALKLSKNGIHVDLCGWMLNGDERFLQSSIRDYALVCPAAQIENTEETEFLGRKFRIPSPAEVYLESEYGPGWCNLLPPEECGSFKSKSRVYGYLASRGITP